MFIDCIEAQKEFEKCWGNTAYTQIALDDVDVNNTLSYYTIDKPLIFTQEMLWDMEKKKAWDPEHYIPYVIRERSAESWGKHPCSMTDGYIFARLSEQKQWLHPNIYEMVYEEVYVNNKEKLVTFIGTKSLPDRSGELMPKQPLFYVQHAVCGSENRPLNKWRLVHLTEAKDEKLIAHFKSFNNATMLPGYIEFYIKNYLGISIRHK